MDGRKPYGPRFTIKDKAFFLDNKKAKPVDRSDRQQIDNWNLQIFWSVEPLRNDFIQRAEKVRKLLEIPELSPKSDRVQKPGSKQPSVFASKSLYVGVNSQFLVDNPTTAQKIEKAVYNNFLMPYGWSFNYYPFVEYYILYGKPTFVAFPPNPKQLQLTLKYRKELGRNRYTKSDIAFLKQQAIIERSVHPKSKRYVDTITDLVSSLKPLKNTDRRPKNPELKILAFSHFNKAHKKIVEREWFLADQIYNILDIPYSDDKKLVSFSPEDQKKKYQTIRKLYSEYLKLIHTI